MELGDSVILAGKIAGIQFAAGCMRELQTYVVQLADGQRISTNVMNLAVPAETEVVVSGEVTGAARGELTVTVEDLAALRAEDRNAREAAGLAAAAERKAKRAAKNTRPEA